MAVKREECVLLYIYNTVWWLFNVAECRACTDQKIFLHMSRYAAHASADILHKHTIYGPVLWFSCRNSQKPTNTAPPPANHPPFQHIAYTQPENVAHNWSIEHEVQMDKVLVNSLSVSPASPHNNCRIVVYRNCSYMQASIRVYSCCE